MQRMGNERASISIAGNSNTNTSTCIQPTRSGSPSYQSNVICIRHETYSSSINNKYIEMSLMNCNDNSSSSSATAGYGDDDDEIYKKNVYTKQMITDEDGEDREKGFRLPYINFYLLSEREADYLLAISTPLYVKLLFICTNLPYFIMGFGVLAQTQVKEHAYPEFLAGVCSFPFVYFVFAMLIAATSTTLHSSQMRLGNVFCCRRKYAEMFHRRSSQDIFDVADCTCAAFAVVATISCQYHSNIFNMMIFIVPVFFASILAKKLQLWNLYVITHGLWHLGTAAILWDVVMPELDSFGW